MIFIMSRNQSSKQICAKCVLLLNVLSVITFTSCAELKHIYTIPEEQRPGSYIGNIPQDTGLNTIISKDDFSNLRYSFLTRDDPNIELFSLGERSGDLSTSSDTSKSLDREKLCRFTSSCVFVIEVAIKSILNQFFRTVELKIVLEDVNDNVPIFPKNETTVQVSESISVNTTILITGARDMDSGKYSIQTYRLESPDDSFGIIYSTKVDGTSEVNVFTKKELDFEATKQYELKLIAADGGEPSLEGVMRVRVKVTDVNDNKPRFFPLAYNITVEENIKPNSTILTVTATDADSGDNGAVVYGLSQYQSSKILKLFSIDSKTGNLIVVNDLQKEEDEKYEIIVEASDKGMKSYTTQTMVTVNVLDTVNDAPKIRVNLLSSRNFSLVSENANIGTVVAHIAVHDSDRGRNGIARCQLSVHQYFELQGFDLNEYKVIVSKPLDHELTPVHSVTVSCQDAGSPPLSAHATFDVRVSDENDNPPLFTQSVYFVSVRENNNIGDTIVTVIANDSDEGDNGKIEYSILSSNGSQFLVSPDTGEVKTNTIFDYESRRSWKLTVKAADRGMPSLSSTARVVVTILDVNDEKPKLTRNLYEFAVSENVETGKYVGSVNAFDFEAGDNGKVVIKLDEDNVDISPFFLFENGSVVVQGSLDYEVRSAYRFKVIAADKGKPPLSSSAEVEISVLDENDNFPVISFPNNEDYISNVTISDKPDKVFARVVAHDVDSGKNGQLKYTIGSRNDSRRFVINHDTGEITMSRFLEKSDIGIYRLMLTVQDRGLPPRASYALLLVHVLLGNGTRGGATSANEQNVLITVSLICLTAIISAVIVLVIIVMRRNDKKRRCNRGALVYVANTTPGYLDKTKLGGLVEDRDEKQKRSSDDSEFGFVLNGRQTNVGQMMQKDAQNQDDVNADSKSSSDSGTDQRSNQFSTFQNHQTLLTSYQEQPVITPKREVWTGYHDEVESNGSIETTTSDSGRGGSEEDPNEFHETSRENGQNSLKPGLKDPVLVTSRKRVTFKDPSEKRKHQYNTRNPCDTPVPYKQNPPISYPQVSYPPESYPPPSSSSVPYPPCPPDSYPPSCPSPSASHRTQLPPFHEKQFLDEHRNSSHLSFKTPDQIKQCEKSKCSDVARSPFTNLCFPSHDDTYRDVVDGVVPSACYPYPKDWHNDSLDNDDDRSTTTSGSYTIETDGQCLYLDGSAYRNVVV